MHILLSCVLHLNIKHFVCCALRAPYNQHTRCDCVWDWCAYSTHVRKLRIGQIACHVSVIRATLRTRQSEVGVARKRSARSLMVLIAYICSNRSLLCVCARACWCVWFGFGVLMLRRNVCFVCLFSSSPIRYTSPVVITPRLSSTRVPAAATTSTTTTSTTIVAALARVAASQPSSWRHRQHNCTIGARSEK